MYDDAEIIPKKRKKFVFQSTVENGKWKVFNAEDSEKSLLWWKTSDPYNQVKRCNYYKLHFFGLSIE